MHISLDAFANSELKDFDWIKVDEEIFDHGHHHIEKATTALYGRNTFDLMQSYWPTAADKPDATKHEKEHGAWYKSVEKIVVSKTMKPNEGPDYSIASNDLLQHITKIKNESGGDIIILGSPSLVHSLQQLNLIDEYFLNINPVLLGKGTPMFHKSVDRTKLTLLEEYRHTNGVLSVRYCVQK